MNLLLTGAWQGALSAIPQIETMGHKAVFLPQERDPLPCDPTWVEGVVCNGLFLHHPIEDFPNLRFIQLTSAGYDRVPMDFVQARGIGIRNARGVYSAPMAEFAVACVLQCYKQLPFFRENQKARVWEKRRDLRELTGKTVLIVGCGSVGTECARRFRAFDARVLGVDLLLRTDASYDRMHPLTSLDELLPAADVLILTVPLTEQTRGLIGSVRLAAMKPDAVLLNLSRGAVIDEPSLAAHLHANPAFTAALDEALPAADVLILTVPLTEATRGLISAARLAAMKPDAVLVNISRGPVVDEAALASHLKDAPQFSAVLDVFEQEPLPEASPLWTCPNALLTPHNSFVGSRNSERLRSLILENLSQF